MNEARKETELERSIKKSFRGGKNRLAALIDRSAFCLLIGVGAFVFSRALRIRPAPAAVIGVFAVIASFFSASALFRRGLRAHSMRLRERTRAALMRERILLLDERALSGLLAAAEAERADGASILLPQKSAPLCEDDVYSAVRGARSRSGGPPKRLILITLSEPDEGARRCAEGLSAPEVELTDAKGVPALREAFFISEAEIDAAIIAGAKASPPKRLRLAAELLSTNAGKYALLGAILFGASFFMRFAQYFRAVGALCFALFLRLRTYERLKLLRTGGR